MGEAESRIQILCHLTQPGWKGRRCLLTLLVKGEDSFSYFGTHCDGSFDSVDWPMWGWLMSCTFCGMWWRTQVLDFGLLKYLIWGARWLTTIVRCIVEELINFFFGLISLCMWIIQTAFSIAKLGQLQSFCFCF